MNEESKSSKLKSKENLYALFYEIISEIKGCKIEIKKKKKKMKLKKNKKKKI